MIDLNNSILKNSEEAEHRKTSVYLTSETVSFFAKYPNCPRSKILNRVIKRYEKVIDSTRSVNFDHTELKILKRFLPRRYEPPNLYDFLKSKKDCPSNLLVKVRNLSTNQEIVLLDQLDNIGYN